MRPGPGKARGAKHRRAVGVTAPLVGAGLFCVLLLYWAHAFSRFGGDANEPYELSDPGSGGGAADPRGDRSALAAADGGGRSGPHHSSWLSAAALWAEEHHHQVRGPRLRRAAASCSLKRVKEARCCACPPGVVTLRPAHLPALPISPRPTAHQRQGQPLPAPHGVRRAALRGAAGAAPAHPRRLRLHSRRGSGAAGGGGQLRAAAGGACCLLTGAAASALHEPPPPPCRPSPPSHARSRRGAAAQF